MNNQERLEEVKKFAETLIEKHVNEGEYHPDQISALSWLIQQVEEKQRLEEECKVRRVELLEEHIGRLEQEKQELERENKIINARNKRISDQAIELQQQNKRYREVITDMNYHRFSPDIIEEIYQALEGEE